MNALEIVHLTKETIYEALLDEQETNPLFFSGELQTFTAAVVNNQVKLSFYPDILPQAVNEQFFAKIGLLLHELKRFMVDKDYGAWFSTTINITPATNTYWFTFNYDDFIGELNDITVEDYIEELKTYPRKPQYVPDWLKQLVA